MFAHGVKTIFFCFVLARHLPIVQLSVWVPSLRIQLVLQNRCRMHAATNTILCNGQNEPMLNVVWFFFIASYMNSMRCSSGKSFFPLLSFHVDFSMMAIKHATIWCEKFVAAAGCCRLFYLLIPMLFPRRFFFWLNVGQSFNDAWYIKAHIKIYKKKNTEFLSHSRDAIYLPHSVAFCNGHSEAVAMNPWRRLSTRVLWSSPLQHGTIVPVPWVNGVDFESFDPISVPVVRRRKWGKKREKETEKEKQQWIQMHG